MRALQKSATIVVAASILGTTQRAAAQIVADFGTFATNPETTVGPDAPGYPPLVVYGDVAFTADTVFNTGGFMGFNLPSVPIDAAGGNDTIVINARRNGSSGNTGNIAFEFFDSGYSNRVDLLFNSAQLTADFAEYTLGSLVAAAGGGSFNFADLDGLQLTNVGLDIEIDYVRTSPTVSAVQTWQAAGGGDWGNAANWANGQIPDGLGTTAVFGDTIASPATVTLNAPRTISNIRFGSGQGYTIAGPSTLTLDNNARSVELAATAGVHTISAPIVQNQPIRLDVSSGASITITSSFDSNQNDITKRGEGVATIRVPQNANNLVVDGGSLQLSPVTSGTTVGRMRRLFPNVGSLDITNNSFVVDYDDNNSLVGDIIVARNDGRLTSSSSVPAGQIVVIEAADLYGSFPATWRGQEIDASTGLVAYTLAGDSDLDGVVGFSDLLALALNYNVLTGTTWADGDFTGDGAVDFADLLTIAVSYNRTVYGPGDAAPASDFDADWARALALVPEPVMSALLLVAVPALARRRRA